MNCNITTTDTPSDEELNSIAQHLRDHNLAAAGPHGYRPLAVVLRSDSGDLLGGLKGCTYWGWLYVEHLAIDPNARGVGIGSQLLQAAETEARERGCHGIYLDTFSFQAREFYEKNGFTVFGTLDEFPVGQQRFFLQKKILTHVT